MRWFWVTGYVLFVIVLHVVPIGGGATLSSTEFGPIRADYLLHLVIFLPWMFLMPSLTEVARSSGWLSKWAVWMALGSILAAGAEVMQFWVPHRAFNPMDAVFNVAGVLAGGLIVGGFRLMKRTENSK